jgi:hypothetical protein
MSATFLYLGLCKHLLDSSHSIPSWTRLTFSLMTKLSLVTTEPSFGLVLKKMLSAQCLELYIPAISFTLGILDPIKTELLASFQPLTPYTISRVSCARCIHHPIFMPLLIMAVSYHLPAGVRAWLLHVCTFFFSVMIVLTISSPVGSNKTPAQSNSRKRNMNIFGVSKIAPPPVLWYQKNFPPFLDFDQDGKCFFLKFAHVCPTDCYFCLQFSSYLRRIWQAIHVREGRFCFTPISSSLQEDRRPQVCRPSPLCLGHCFFHHECILEDSPSPNS